MSPHSVQRYISNKEMKKNQRAVQYGFNRNDIILCMYSISYQNIIIKSFFYITLRM